MKNLALFAALILPGCTSIPNEDVWDVLDFEDYLSVISDPVLNDGKTVRLKIARNCHDPRRAYFVDAKNPNERSVEVWLGKPRPDFDQPCSELKIFEVIATISLRCHREILACPVHGNSQTFLFNVKFK